MRLPKGLSVIEHNNILLAKLYNTLVVVADQSGPATKITLDSGGWRTKHTKKCINLVLNDMGLSLYQKNYEWKVKMPDGSILDFQDGMTFAV